MVRLTSTKCVLAVGAVAGAAIVSAFVRKSTRTTHRQLSALGRQSSVPSRHVRVLVRGQQLTSEPREVSIASWNMLCEPFATPNRLPHVVPMFLTYQYRWPLMQKELESFGSDIIALQEVTVARWPELEAFMKTLGYQGIVQKKEHDFLLALFYKVSKLNLIWSEERSRAILAELQLRDAVDDDDGNGSALEHGLSLNIDTGGNVSDSGSENGNSINDDNDSHHHKKKNTNHNTKQAPSNPKRLLYVINAHLEGSPYRPNDRVAQIKHALQRLEHHLDIRGVAYEAAKLIICGDFNSLPDDSPSVFLREGYLEAEHHETYLPEVAVTGKKAITHPFHLADVYETAHAVPPFTRKVSNEGGRLDFCYCTNTLTTRAVLRPLKEEHKEIVLRDYLPNKLHPSDHLPVGCVLSYSNDDLISCTEK